MPTTPDTAPTSSEDAPAHSEVCSPMGIRLVSGLVAPYLSITGQRELQARWGHGANTLFRDAVETERTLRAHPALHAALGVWVRNHRLPVAAAESLGDLVGLLPLDDTAAQRMLDGWAATNTHDMIETFPAQVQSDTTAVLASAVAVEDTWKAPAQERRVQFNSEYGAGFEAALSPWDLTATTDGSTVRARLRLQSGLMMQFAISTHGPVEAARLLATPEVFTVSVTYGLPFVSVEMVEHPTEMVAFRAPEFTTRTTHDLTVKAPEWGLSTAFKEGAPGLGDLPLSGAVQDAFIEITHTGVRAAAVTAMMCRSANVAVPPRAFQQMVVTLDQPFAYRIISPALETPLFTGIYTG